MKTLTSFLFFCFFCFTLKAQSLYPIFIESYKHVNSYIYNDKTDLKEYLDRSIKPNKYGKRNLDIISTALMSSNFKFDNANDTILIVRSYLDYAIFYPPISVYAYAKSSKSVAILLYDIRSFDVPGYRDLGLERDYPYGDFYPSEPDAFREFYDITVKGSSSGQEKENIFYLMYHGNVSAFKEYYINNMGRVLGGFDNVLRIVIKDGKVVYPTMQWEY